MCLCKQALYAARKPEDKDTLVVLANRISAHRSRVANAWYDCYNAGLALTFFFGRTCVTAITN